ncbi:MAG: type II toxin-antitoxin system VapC family toxin [Burkholderiaceae bacterium]
MKYLLDTCVLSEVIKSVPNPHVLIWFQARKPTEICISAMTWGELQRGVNRLAESKRKLELTAWLQALEVGLEDRVLAFDHTASKFWAQITVTAEAQGRPMAAFDSIIAAIALAHRCILVTRNVRDFFGARIDILNPWDIQD